MISTPSGSGGMGGSSPRPSSGSGICSARYPGPTFPPLSSTCASVVGVSSARSSSRNVRGSNPGSDGSAVSWRGIYFFLRFPRMYAIQAFVPGRGFPRLAFAGLRAAARLRRLDPPRDPRDLGPAARFCAAV